MSNWTMVTGFFRLDSGYSLDRYKLDSAFTLGLDVNIIIYCDNSLYDYIIEKRKPFEKKTKVIQTTLTDLPYAKYVKVIEENRKEKYPHGYPDSRNTPWYFILTMSKFSLLRRAINENPLNSTHFAWLDFKYSQADAKSELLYKALECNRDLFSCCLIDYFPRLFALEYPEIFYQSGGPCTVAAGFFTAKKDIMSRIIDLMEEEFIDIIGKKYGHAEQQLMYVLLLKYPELFDFYVGDYPYLLLNYVKPIDMTTTKNCLLPNILAYGDKQLEKEVMSKI